MRRKVLLSSLGVGRCFTLEVSPGGSEEKGSEVKRTTPILPPEAAWKVTGDEDGQVVAESATGQRKTFAPNTKVVEVPRQGFDSLLGRRA
jgi:hypothetical protein